MFLTGLIIIAKKKPPQKSLRRPSVGEWFKQVPTMVPTWNNTQIKGIRYWYKNLHESQEKWAE